MSSRKLSESPTRRRDFLRGSMTAGVGAIAATVTAGSALAVTTEPAVDQAGSKPQGYRVTQHILDYYKTAAL